MAKPIKKITILGATGYIGRNALDVITRYPRKFSVFGLSANKNISLFKQQIIQYSPKVVAVADEKNADEIARLFPKLKVYKGEKGLVKMASLTDAHMVVSAIVGAAGLMPTLAAINAGRHIALANKETLVIAGDLVMRRAKKNNINILPIDSEHNALFQLLQLKQKRHIRKLIITASGGPFFGKSPSQLKKVTVKNALAHPTWSMGNKITIDSSTMMNKGFEVIEAHHLFDISYDNIEVVVHPESTVHSMIESANGDVFAQLGPADMRFPILSALSYPEIIDNTLPRIKISQISQLTFYEPDYTTFPLLTMAYDAGRRGHCFPAVLNAANEIAVNAFLEERLSYLGITQTVKSVMDKFKNHKKVRVTLDAILTADTWARQTAEKLITTKKK